MLEDIPEMMFRVEPPGTSDADTSLIEKAEDDLGHR